MTVSAPITLVAELQQKTSVVPLCVVLYEPRSSVIAVKLTEEWNFVFLDPKCDGADYHLIRDQPDPMAIHLCRKIVFCQNELFEGMHAVSRDHQLFTSIGGVEHDLQLPVKLLKIEHAVFYAAEVAVPQQVILFVGVERTRHNRA